MDGNRQNIISAKAMTPQQRMRKALPRQRKFTVELAGWPEQRRFMTLRRIVFAAYVGLAAGCALVGGFFSGSVPGVVPPVVLLAALGGFAAGGAGFIAMRNAIFLAGLLVGGALLGVALGVLGGTDVRQLAWAGCMVGLPLAGHVLNGLFWRSPPSPFRQFLAWLPWLAAGTACCWYAGAATTMMVFLGMTSNLVVYLDIYTLDASMQLRDRTEILPAAGDILYMPFLGGRLANGIAGTGDMTG